MDDNIIHYPYDIDINFDKALSEYVFKALTKNSGKIAQIDSCTGKTETFGELLNRSLSLAQSLKEKGVTTNDIVALYCYNNMDYLVVMIACTFLGTRFCALDIVAPSSSTVHCLKLTAPILIFCEEEHEDLLEQSIKEAGIKCKIITFDKSKKFENNSKFEIDTSRKMKDSACIVFTSGTSGLSKGAELRNFGLYYAAINLYRFISEIERISIFTLPYWISNLIFCYFSILFGVERVIFKTFDMKTVAKVIQDYKVNSSLFSPHVMCDIIKNPQFIFPYDSSSLKLLFVGGSKVGANQLNQLQKLFPQTKFMNVMGMTELTGATFEPIKGVKVDAHGNISVGIPFPGFYYKIVEIQSGESLGPNKKGELRLKYDGIFNGYFNQPETTEEALDKDGYFKTGDIAYYDENYNFFIVDRLKEIFKYRGFHISPSIIEDTLLLHPDVKDCAIIPVPHEHDGELPKAVVQLKESTNTDQQDIIQFIEERLEDPYHLRGGVFFNDAIPKTSSGKIRRKYLADLVMNKIVKKV